MAILYCTHVCMHVDFTGLCVDGDVRLVDGANKFQGRLEVCDNDEWGTACQLSFDNKDATVVCRQLGYSDIGCQLCQVLHIHWCNAN